MPEPITVPRRRFALRLTPARRLAPLLWLCAATACGSRHDAAPSVAGQVVDAARGTPVAGAEIFINGRSLRVVSDARGYFHAPLPRGSTTASLSVHAEGYVRVSVPRAVNASGLAIALAAATPARKAASPLAATVAGSYAKTGPQIGPAPTRTDAQFAGSGSGSFFGPTPPGTVVAPGCAVCSPLYPNVCCACAQGCPLVAIGTAFCGVPPPPFTGAPLPAGCLCQASSCPGYVASTTGGTTGGGTAGGGTTGGGTTGGGTTGGAPAPVPDPPPPASYDYSRWAVDPNSADTAYFNYIGGCLSFADDGSPASSNQDDINFYLTIYPANSVSADNLPVAMLYTGSLGPTEPVETLPTQGLVVADISAYQAGRRLMVTPGTSCMMMVVLPDALSSQVSAATTIYSADPASAIYRRRGTGSDGWLYWDPTPRHVLWPVDELTTWQVGKPAFSSGGCMQGLMVSACDGSTPVPRRGVRVNAIDGQGTRAWSGTTDAQGHYCVDTPIDSFWPFMDTVRPQPSVRYFVTGVELSETAMCDPLPDGSNGSADCRTCQPGLQGSEPAFSLCTSCQLVDALPSPVVDPRKFIDTCAPPPTKDPLREAVLVACSFCTAALAAREAPTGCQLSDGTIPPISTTSCTNLDTTLGFGNTADGKRCTCKFAGSSCDYRNDQCCFVGPLDTSVRGHNQGGCRPGTIEPTAGRCGRCTVGVVGGLCNADSDICCNFDYPTMPVACLDSTCVPVDSGRGVDR